MGYAETARGCAVPGSGDGGGRTGGRGCAGAQRRVGRGLGHCRPAREVRRLTSGRALPRVHARPVRPRGRPGGGAEGGRSARGATARSCSRCPRRAAASSASRSTRRRSWRPKLAARHPDIKTYAGRGIDDPTATVRADTDALGFHASVRSPDGAWYVDPYYRLDDSVYVSYFARDLAEDPHGAFVERGPRARRDPLDLGAAAEAGRRAVDPAAHLPARAGHRPDVRDLLRRPGERHRGQGHADEPRRPDLRGRDRRSG